MKNTKTKRLVLMALLSSLGMILNLIEIPYPLAPWLNIDLSEIVVLVAVNVLGLQGAVVVSIMKMIISIVVKGPVGPIAIGQIAAFIASLSIAFGYYFLKKKIKNYFVAMFITMTIFAFIMFVINYYFVTPTYLMGKPTWYTDLPFAVDVNAFNSVYGSNLSVPGFLSFLTPYQAAIFIIYYPFNFIKGIFVGIVYSFVRPLETKLIKN